MSLSKRAFEKLRSHWAVEAIGAENISRAHRLVNERLAQRALGGQIAFAFTPSPIDNELLDRVLLAYELAATEGLDELSRPEGKNADLRDQSVAASSRAFDIRRLSPLPKATNSRLYSILQLSALAYCGDRWSDVRRWYAETPETLDVPNVIGASWDQRLLYRLYDCWIRLFRKHGWNDLARVQEIITSLRADQKTLETSVLRNAHQATDRAIALRLAALYHWAKGTEILAAFMLGGHPSDPFSQIDKHFEAGITAARASGDPQHEMILRWLHATSRIMVTNSLWWTTRSISSQTSSFVHSLTHRDHHGMFELLPPQRSALLEQGLLDQAKTAIVVDLPTSGGKTLLAQFRIIQALNQFDLDNGWVAYVAPTRALTAQLTRRLRRDFNPIGIRVEQLTGAIDIDAFEEAMLDDKTSPFDVLISTPEKLSLVIRNQKVTRPLALVVMDEAHNIENTQRGLRVELLLATVKRDCPQANFLLLMPFVADTQSIARWLAQDINAGQAISLSTAPWKPNERIIGLYSAIPDESETAGWRLAYETLTTTPKAMPLHGSHLVGGVRPIDVPRSRVYTRTADGQDVQKGLGMQTAAIATVLSERGTSIAVANNINTVWKMSERASHTLPILDPIPEDIRLVQDFLRTEVSYNYDLIHTLSHGVGVHHAGLSDDVRALMEWLAETGCLRMLCATSTIAQGINFPVSSIFLASRYLPTQGRSIEMEPRDFWNLVGRAGRIDHDSVGVVGIAKGSDQTALIDYVSRNTGALVSRLITMIDELALTQPLATLADHIWEDQWEDFRCYIAHLWAEKKSLDAVLADSENLLRHTYGYSSLRSNPTTRPKADALLEAAQRYARKLAEMPPGVAELADSTGFSPEGVNAALRGIRGLEEKLTPSDWEPDSLFGNDGKIASLFGVMLNIPQLRDQLEAIGGQGFDRTRISDITRDWVNGKGLDEIAREYFYRENDKGGTAALSDACRAIYRAIVNSGTWGISALSQVSGIDLDSLPEFDRRRINALPAMIYHGVRSEDAVLMRMNAAPRSSAEALGAIYRDITGGDETRYSVGKAREFLKTLSSDEWTQARPSDAALSGSGYKRVWEVLSGDGE